jgi:hypothetical protein
MKVPQTVIDEFLASYDYVSKEAAKDNIRLMLENKPVVAMAYHVELKSGRFEPYSTVYPGKIRSLPAEQPCQVWLERMKDSVKGEDKTYLIPCESYNKAEKLAKMLNEVL